MIKGSIDIHVNSGPCFMPRVGNAFDMAVVAAAAGVRGWVFLSHHESTVGRAAVVEAALPGFRCAGGIVLNDYVGGINPVAVRGAFLSGGRFISFPTLHAENHAKVVGKGRAGVGPGDPAAGDGIRITDTRNELIPQARECIDLAAQHHGYVQTGHVSNEEIEAVVDYCVARNVPVIVTHPYFIVLGSEAFFAGLAKKGAFIEVCGAVVMPVHPVATVEKMASLVRACTPARCILASDAGSVQIPIPHETVRSFSWNLVKHGISEDEVRLMAAENPRRLLNWT